MVDAPPLPVSAAAAAPAAAAPAAVTTTMLSTSVSPPRKMRSKRPASEMAPGLSTDYPPPPHPENDIETIDVLVVGAGPAGLMLATNLTRFGVKVKVIDDRLNKTPAGRADGLQPKTIETFKQMRIADDVLRKGVKIFDISFWNSSPEKALQRTGRQDHFPMPVDVLEPYILLVHQGMVEGLFLDDMAERGVTVSRQCSFEGYRISQDTADAEYPVEAVYMDRKNEIAKKVRAKYVVGCDGAHSNVRRSMPGVAMEGETSDAFWGVLDGVVETDFPDLWSKWYACDLDFY